MFACYRRSDAADPELYCAATAAVLAGFSKPAVEYVTDPRTGIASELKWLPAVAEVRAACVAAEIRLAALAKPDFQRPRRTYQPPIQTPPGTSYTEMVAKYGRPTGRFESAGDKWNGGR